MEETKSTEKNLLGILLDKNAYGEGLTDEEYYLAVQLIGKPEFTEEDCWVCKISTPRDVDKAIYDTGLCQGHAYYALNARK